VNALTPLKLRAKVLAFVLENAWRSEDTVINHFEHPRAVIEDALFDLVNDGKLEWFGAEGQGDKPMRYRRAKTKAAMRAA
jgi:predicted HTH transcriptional regulator